MNNEDGGLDYFQRVLDDFANVNRDDPNAYLRRMRREYAGYDSLLTRMFYYPSFGCCYFIFVFVDFCLIF